MSLVRRVGTGRALIALAVVGLLTLTLFAGVAFAADTDPSTLDPATVQQVFAQLQAAPVIEANCGGCHGNIADTKNFSAAITFTHANHLLVQCSACHTRFPHRPEGTARPTMKGCFDCHGVRHGPTGLLATGVCTDCHVTPRDQLRPSDHPINWGGRAHVAPAKAEFNTRCAMCHDQASCDTCHKAKNITWSPATWAYDSSDGCLSCHGNALLQKASSAGSKSFAVTGLEDSVHQDVTCQGCHTDYRYDDQKQASPLWNINASNACAKCHAQNKDKRLSAPVAAYEKSVHGKAIADGKLEAATCGSCHGGHYIFSTKTATGKARMHASSYRVCARCKQHGSDYDTYDDQYHGRAYKGGSAEAPACWQCHDSHDIQKKGEPTSKVNEAKVGKTCGQKGCHTGSDEKFGVDNAALIHSRTDAEATNPLVRLIRKLTGKG